MDEGREAQVSRRGVLDLFLSGSLLSVVASVFYPVWRYVAPPRIVESAVGSVVAAKVGELAPNAGKIFRFGSRPGILIRTTSGEWRAFSARSARTCSARCSIEPTWSASGAPATMGTSI